MHYGKSQAIGDKSIFIIDTAMSVVDGRLYYEYCNKGDSTTSFLRAVDVATGNVLWDHRMRESEGMSWFVDERHLMLCDQVLDARTGECLFDFHAVPGMQARHWPVPVELDAHRWLVAMEESSPEGRYLLLDRRTWQGSTLALGLQGAFVLEGAVYGWIVHPERSELRRWHETDGHTEHVLWVDSARDLYSPAIAGAWAVFGPGSRDHVDIDAPWLRIHPCSGEVLAITPPVQPDDERRHVHAQRAAHRDGVVYFCFARQGMYGYDIRSNRFGPCLSPTHVSAPQCHAGVLYGIQDRHEDGMERAYLVAVDPDTGAPLWETPCSSRNYRHLSVSECGVFLGIAGGKIQHLPPAGRRRSTPTAEPAKRAKRAESAKSAKAATGPVRTVPPESPYAHMLDDMPTLLDALQARACAQSPNSTLTAVAVSKPWAMVACIEYGEDPDFPHLRLLDLQTDAWIALDCNDLIDAPMIEGITFVDGQDGQLDLLLHDGGRHTIHIDLPARTVRWNAEQA
ncbi:hypothetical protein [Delftia lacustris]|uniref:hypothetical protein n=1 Tax=Delftia lacustris TaxID=558537 RepID=UPI002861CC99|nr:hypothetical protein [Delftia lacustris]MDR6732052.1 hypothetical protein [Delftia lacustris]